MKVFNIGKKVLVASALIIVTFLMLFGCSSIEKMQSGHFELRDGVDTYIREGQVIVDALVTDDGKLYYTDDKGHKVKDAWKIIDNDGNYGYFGSLGDLVIDKIREINGKAYYFDKDGKLYTDNTGKKVIIIEGVEYVANSNGELKLASGVAIPTKETETTVKKVVPQTPVATIAPVTTVAPVVTAAPVATNAPIAPIDPLTTTVVSPINGPGATIVAPAADVTSPTAAAASTEVKISKNEKVIDTIEGDNYDCKITLLKPVIVSTTAEETAAINSCIEDLMDTWLSEVITRVEEYDDLPKSVTITSTALGTIKKASISINMSGSLKTKAGSTKTLKYRITYDRESETAELTRIS